jgi:Uma2 family endonuclease
LSAPTADEGAEDPGAMLPAMLEARDIAPDRPRPLRRDEYAALVDQGRFEDEHVELLEGLIVEMSPQGTDHANAIVELTELLVLALAGRAKVRPQCSFIAGETSQPEPDLAVVRIPRRGDPHPSAAFLIVEVAQTSVAKDRGVKARLYAAAGVTEYWVVDLPSNAIEVRTLPSGGAYTQCRTARLGDTIRLAAFPDVELQVAAILAP